MKKMYRVTLPENLDDTPQEFTERYLFYGSKKEALNRARKEAREFHSAFKKTEMLSRPSDYLECVILVDLINLDGSWTAKQKMLWLAGTGPFYCNGKNIYTKKFTDEEYDE